MNKDQVKIKALNINSISKVLIAKAREHFAKTGEKASFRLTEGTVVHGRTCAYVVTRSGSFVRLNPKPHKNKAERKRMKRERVAQRKAARLQSDETSNRQCGWPRPPRSQHCHPG